MQKTNLMTQETKERLERDLVKAEREYGKASKRIGEAAGPESDWHDNAAYDEALRQHDLKSSLLTSIKEKLQNVEILEPRQESGSVGIGNTVVLKFEEMDEEEVLTVLGKDDGVTGRDKGWISYKTSVAKAIMGHKQGDRVTLKLGNTNSQEIKIVKIRPGAF